MVAPRKGRNSLSFKSARGGDFPKERGGTTSGVPPYKVAYPDGIIWLRVISEITRKRVVEVLRSEERSKTKERSDAGIYYRQRVILSGTEWSRSFFERQSEEKPRSGATQGSTEKFDVPYQNKCNIYYGKSDRTVCRSRVGSRLALSLVRLRSTRESSTPFHYAQDDTLTVTFRNLC